MSAYKTGILLPSSAIRCMSQNVLSPHDADKPLFSQWGLRRASAPIIR
jgi:hypothetical protein